jgi:hypothetical protein
VSAALQVLLEEIGRGRKSLQDGSTSLRELLQQGLQPGVAARLIREAMAGGVIAADRAAALLGVLQESLAEDPTQLTVADSSGVAAASLDTPTVFAVRDETVPWVPAAREPDSKPAANDATVPYPGGVASSSNRAVPEALDDATSQRLPALGTQITNLEEPTALLPGADGTNPTERMQPTSAPTSPAIFTSYGDLSSASAAHFAAADRSASTHRGPIQPGVVLKNRFLLETLIGRGGMGLVFAAIDRRKEEARDPNPRVALKVLSGDFQRHPAAFMALQREARKAQTLAHPNVVTVFDFDRDGDAVYMTMELLQGRPLEAVVKEARGKGLAREAALPIIQQMAEGLAYAHRKRIVHSDLKPGNVFLLDDGTPKILDFGIARAMPSAKPGEATDVFDAGSLHAYTEAYATEEMIEGVDPHPCDDLYALGIIAYELLIGEHPYKRKSSIEARKSNLKPPSLKGLKLREARALEKCLFFERERRPQNADEFLKLFRATWLQKALIATAASFAVVAVVFWYQYRVEAGPAMPFERLPVETQQQFKSLMAEGQQEWGFYERDGNVMALYSAVDRFAAAYDLHPRNRDAVTALEAAAQGFLDSTRNDIEKRRELAKMLQEKSEYYRKYQPLVEAGAQ